MQPMIRNEFKPDIRENEMTIEEVRKINKLIQNLLAYGDEIELCGLLTSNFVNETFSNLNEFGKYLTKRLTKLDTEKLRKWTSTSQSSRELTQQEDKQTMIRAG